MSLKAYLIIGLVIAGLLGLYGLYRHGKTVEGLEGKAVAADQAADVTEVKDEIRNRPRSLDTVIDELCCRDF